MLFGVDEGHRSVQGGVGGGAAGVVAIETVCEIVRGAYVVRTVTAAEDIDEVRTIHGKGAPVAGGCPSTRFARSGHHLPLFER
jgi:hypothetical protein